MPLHRARLRLPFILLIVALVLPLSACEAATSTLLTDQVSLAADQPSPLSRSPAESLAEGRRLVQYGEWEQAAAAFGAAVAGGGDVGQAAQLELAVLQQRNGHPREAAALLDGLVSQPPVSEPVVRAWFVMGWVQNDLGDREAAARAFSHYVDLGGPAAAYAQLEAGRARAVTDGEAALAALQPLLDGNPPLYVKWQALRLAGQLEEAAERYDRALARYTALGEIAAWSSDRLFGRFRAAEMQYKLGNAAAAVEGYRAVAAGYPYNAEAATALSRLEELGQPADLLVAGIVHYRQRANQQARDEFNAWLRANGSTGRGAATALFFLGALAERRGDTRLALEDYQEAYDADPAGPYAVESLWERASVFDYTGDLDGAIAAYNLVAQRFPGSGRAGDAAFRAGYMQYSAGRTQAARDAWSAAAAGQNSPATARVAFWAARAARDLGDVSAALQGYGEAARRDPTGYYGLRAAALLAGDARAPAVGSGRLDATPADWAQAEAWLASWAGPEDGAAWQAAGAAEDWRAGTELLALGWVNTGTTALQLAEDARAKQPWVLYRMARTLWDAGYPHLAFGAASDLLALAPAAPPMAAAAITRLTYPTPWPETVQQYADQYGIDPLLLYALMRQESAYNPTAGSSAGAFGLTQVIPDTAQEIAKAVGKSPFEFRDLARPVVAIQFGAYYIGAQLKSFGGNVYLALAAYNGGAGNASRWSRAGGPNDIDRFYEEIDYTETRTYLRTVIQNYAWYRYLYGGATRPALSR